MKPSAWALITAALSLSSDARAGEALKLIYSADLDTWMRRPDAGLVILDVSVEQARKSEGVIPGAALLSSPLKYNVTKELPQDKNAKLVFYCATESCITSHAAAKRAIQNGYEDVSVLVDGLTGWKKAGFQALR